MVVSLHRGWCTQNRSEGVNGAERRGALGCHRRRRRETGHARFAGTHSGGPERQGRLAGRPQAGPSPARRMGCQRLLLGLCGGRVEDLRGYPAAGSDARCPRRAADVSREGVGWDSHLNDKKIS